MLNSVKAKNIIYAVITVLLVAFSYVHVIFTDLLAVWLLVFSIIKIAKTKNNMLLLLQLFMLIYSVVPILYFILNIPISPHQYLDLNQKANMRLALQTQTVFVVAFLSWAPIESRYTFAGVFRPQKRHMAWLVSVLIMIGSLFFVNWRGVLTSMLKTYSIETESSIIFDYFMVFTAANYFFCDAKVKRAVNIFLAVMVSLICVLIGKRLTAVSLLLLVYILHYDGKLKKWTIILGFIAGTMLFNAIQFTRINQMPSLFNVLTGINIENGVFRSNSCDIWYASEVIVKLISEKVFDWGFRLKSFLGTFLNAFLPSSLTPKEALVNVYITENNLFPYTANGSLIGVSTYLWLSYPGVLLFAYLISLLIRKGMSSRGKLSTLYTVLILATFPRWYTYNPRILFKFAFVAGVVYLCVWIVASSEVTKNRVRKRTNEKK